MIKNLNDSKSNLAKLHNSGNCFVVTDYNFGNEITDIIRLCDPHYGLGGDGAVLVNETSVKDEYALSFVNSDGSYFKMCFNGSLCAALFTHRMYGHFPRSLIMPDFTKIKVTSHGKKITLGFKMPITPFLKNDIIINGELVACYSVFYADNHKVLFFNDKAFLNWENFTELALEIRKPDSFFLDGANVHFACKQRGVIYIRHFEKNIENETYSCGSGCVAAALVLENLNAFKFISPGGNLGIEKKKDQTWSLSAAPKLIAIVKDFLS